jgi:uncharacterized protein
MSTIDRRAFLRRGSALTIGGLTLGGPMQALLARGALAVGSTGVAPNNGGYGPLVPIPDKRDGAVRLELPEGFNYRSFTETGEPMSDGYLTPGRHDGMAAFARGPGASRLRLVRNHEINGPGPAFGDPSKAYDPMAQGGTTTLEVRAHANHVSSWVSCNGTQMNCAGGATPWGSWVTCEETINGPDVGPDFTGGDNTLLHHQHGYIFEVPSRWGLGEHQKPVPIRSAGRFAHEAVDVDPVDGTLYQTEDDFNFPSGFYRYLPPAGANPVAARRIVDGGTLEMLAVTGSPQIELAYGQTPGVTYNVHWVKIDQPDMTFPAGTTNDQAIQFVAQQGFAKGGAKFSRLEGIFYSDRKVYLVSTQGGDTPPGEAPPAGYGDGYGQVWVLDIPRQTLQLIYESPSQEVLDLPDNMCVSPKGSLLLCEDGAVENYLRGINAKGEIFDFARNAIPGREREEFAGSTFSPNGKTLFVNIQAALGLSYAIWGPWARGDL